MLNFEAHGGDGYYTPYTSEEILREGGKFIQLQLSRGREDKIEEEHNMEEDPVEEQIRIDRDRILGDSPDH